MTFAQEVLGNGMFMAKLKVVSETFENDDNDKL